MSVRNAEAVWEGSLREGKGRMKLGSGAFEGPYSFQSRFESGAGTNPEELIGAAHAGCFSMALSGQLGQAGITPERITTTSTVTIEKQPDGFTITRVHLDVAVKAPGADRAKFETAAQNAKAGCPLSKVLKADISMDAKLEA